MTKFETVRAWFEIAKVIQNYLHGLLSEKEAMKKIVNVYFGI